MDRLKIKKKLYAGMGDFAKQKRGEELRKKYSAAPPAMAEQMEKVDEAGEAASLPNMHKDAALKVYMMEDVNSDDFQRAMQEMAESEEDAKWMAKQRG